MELIKFYEKYIPALEKALENDNINDGFYVKDPMSYIEIPENELKVFDVFLDEIAGTNIFLDKVGYYFDAKSHYFKEIEGVEINEYKKGIIKEIELIKNIYSI